MASESRSTQHDGNFSFCRYNPSFVVTIVAAVLYGIAFILTFVQWIRYKSWAWVVMVIAAGSKQEKDSLNQVDRCPREHHSQWRQSATLAGVSRHKM